MANGKKIIGNSILVAWLVFALWAGITLLNIFGQKIGSLFPAYLLALVATIFLGRFLLERLINSFSSERHPVTMPLRSEFEFGRASNMAFSRIVINRNQTPQTFGSESFTGTAALAAIIVFNSPAASTQGVNIATQQTATDAVIQLIGSDNQGTSENLTMTEDFVMFTG